MVFFLIYNQGMLKKIYPLVSGKPSVLSLGFWQMPEIMQMHRVLEISGICFQTGHSIVLSYSKAGSRHAGKLSYILYGV